MGWVNNASDGVGARRLGVNNTCQDSRPIIQNFRKALTGAALSFENLSSRTLSPSSGCFPAPCPASMPKKCRRCSVHFVGTFGGCRLKKFWPLDTRDAGRRKEPLNPRTVCIRDQDNIIVMYADPRTFRMPIPLASMNSTPGKVALSQKICILTTSAGIFQIWSDDSEDKLRLPGPKVGDMDHGILRWL